MKLVATPLPGVVVVEPAVFTDERGWFMESWNQARFDAGLRELGLPAPRPFVQDNHSCSRAGVLRGLHYQLPPHPQGKLVRVVKGAAFDVAVDIRQGSPCFGQWVGVELSAENRHQLWIPEGFAHGFLALEDDTHFLYKTTDVYARDCERALRWDDAALAIAWPLARVGGTPMIAAKDAAAPRLGEAGDGLPAASPLPAPPERE
ncbi:MAG: dTDP-4-dehydrorhamnose 3,5-epimerase [Rubrivivax sp. SCN 71-131]|jgi:dTDP-4-dehydrorhamnose 3,5-epimerase|nr:MAG: dTDP-4-dehydrorhamnose 3,5-epimerase [Rubrivivax sp. SCN 71-131]